MPLDDISKLLDGLINGLHSQRTLNRLGLAGQRTIKSKTRAGLDIHEQPFADYSDKWAEVREVEGLPTNIVNLEFNDVDGMLAHIDHVISNDLKTVALDIEDPIKRKIASYHNDEGAGRSRVVREFWGFTEDDDKDLTGLIGKDIETMLNTLASQLSD